MFDRNKYTASFHEEDKKYNTNQNNSDLDELDNNHRNPNATKLENGNNYPSDEFGEDFGIYQRDRNKLKNLK